jgi:hypothetical protein
MVYRRCTFGYYNLYYFFCWGSLIAVHVSNDLILSGMVYLVLTRLLVIRLPAMQYKTVVGMSRLGRSSLWLTGGYGLVRNGAER